MRALQVIKSAYRCNIEEQDDPAVWIAHALKGAGAELGVLLKGSAVNYALEAQDASGLSFAGKLQTHPPTIAADVAALVSKGIDVLAVEDDARERGVDTSGFVPGVRSIKRSELVGLYAEYDQVWYW